LSFSDEDFICIAVSSIYATYPMHLIILDLMNQKSDEECRLLGCGAV
jgi:hypothetical protein